MKPLQNIFGSLFWRLSIFFLVFQLLVAGIYIYISYRSTLDYSQETSQKLNQSLGERIAKFTEPLIDGVVNEEEVKQLFHNVMVLNPSVEVYLLGNNGEILSYYAPFGKVKLDTLDLAPIHSFIKNKNLFIKAEDPRNPGVKKVFSSAKVINQGKQEGYIYVILSSEEYTTVSGMLANSFQLKLAFRSLIIALLATLITGVIIIWYLTKNLSKITSSLNRFKKGDLTARINLKSKGELSQLAGNINSMSDTIVKNINEIKSVEKLRKELISNVSHDLRTPLTSIQGYAETLVMLDDEIDKKTRIGYVETILLSTQKVKKLVDDLFEISKLESNQVKTHPETFSLNEMLSDIMMKYNLMAQSKSISFYVQIPHTEVLVYADIALMDRVFQNLLDNAFKHTKEGGEIKIEIKKESGKPIQVFISDNGVGIATGELPYIFDRYRKGKRGKKIEGTGLGLAIVKKILDLHKIDIKVESQQDAGTTFSFSLPVA